MSRRKPVERKACRTCGRMMALSSFPTRTYYDGTVAYRGECGRCASVRKAAWVKAKRRSDPALGVLLNCKGGDCCKKRANDLTLDFVRSEIAKPCSYCGTTTRARALDRVDSAVGHTMANSVACCVRCNLIKRDMPPRAWDVVAVGVRSAEAAGLFADWCPGNFLKNTPAAKARAADASA